MDWIQGIEKYNWVMLRTDTLLTVNSTGRVPTENITPITGFRNQREHNHEAVLDLLHSNVILNSAAMLIFE
ncbi:hypothetical protein ABKN59_003612 [Abortiporus biennis]